MAFVKSLTPIEMETTLLIILLLTFVPVIRPFGKKQLKNSGQLLLTGVYLLYLILYLIFWYLVLFKDLNLGYELGNLFFYLIFTVAMVLSNLGMGFRNKIGKELKYFFSALNIIAGIYLVKMIFESNMIK